jgi:hypothetical protein
MALVTMAPTMLGFLPNQWATPTNQVTIDASGEKGGVVFQIAKAGTIDRVLFRTGAVSNAQTLRAGLYTLDAAGDPTTTAYKGMVAGTQTAPAANTLYEVTLGTAATNVVANDEVALVIEFDSVVGNVSFSGAVGVAALQGYPYTVAFTTAWAHNTTAILVAAVRYSDGTYAYVGGMPGTVVATAAFGSGSNPKELGNLWTPSFAGRLCGYWMVGDIDNAAEVLWYDTDGTTVLRTDPLTPANRGSTGVGIFWRRFASPHVWTVGGSYRLVLKPTSASTVLVHRLTVFHADVMQSLPFQTAMVETNKSSGDVWSQISTQRVAIGPIVDQLDDGAGGGPLGLRQVMGGGRRVRRSTYP